MKTLKFKNHLVPDILTSLKNVTWRLFDEKNLQVGDELVLINAASGEKFARAEITGVREKVLGEMEEADFAERGTKGESREKLIAHYRDYYGDRVDSSSVVKIVKFKLLEVL